MRGTDALTGKPTKCKRGAPRPSARIPRRLHAHEVGYDLDASAVALKTPWDDGTTHLFLRPVELVARLAALVPEPGVHTTHYHGVLGPVARGRAEIVPGKRPEKRDGPKASKPVREAWAEMLRRVFAVDALACPAAVNEALAAAEGSGLAKGAPQAAGRGRPGQAKQLRLPWPPCAGPGDVRLARPRANVPEPVAPVATQVEAPTLPCSGDLRRAVAGRGRARGRRVARAGTKQPAFSRPTSAVVFPGGGADSGGWGVDSRS
jgi:hypothetical protein